MTTSESELATDSHRDGVNGHALDGAKTNGVRVVPFDLCIIDEASRATAPELFIPMVRSARTNGTTRRCRFPARAWWVRGGVATRDRWEWPRRLP